MNEAYTNLAYLVAAVCFIVGLKLLSSPKTARLGNGIGATGMLIAIIAVCVHEQILDAWMIYVALGIGAVVGVILAVTVKMTSMPEMVALLNGFGGGASALVGSAELFGKLGGGHADTMTADLMIPIALSVLIGTLTLTGSFIAFGKLQGFISSRQIMFPGQKALNALMGLAAIGLTVWMVIDPSAQAAFWALAGIAAVMGVTLTIPIGCSDMPVVISLLNSYSGLAACAAGFVLQNNALIISGSLVGASGIILTDIMCKSMNRSILNVVFAKFSVEGGGPGAVAEQRPYHQGSVDDAAVLFDIAQKVIIVPGYGMAVAQAQHVVRELAESLEKRGVEVAYAIHPVAGRMPGHMNVLLAEANVPYDKLKEMDEINADFSQTDVALVVGANDITNPTAKTNPQSPLYGMPVLDVDKAKNVIVLKRSMRPGFAGVDNDLYYMDQTLMVFGDAKETVTKMNSAVKAL